MVRSGTKLTDWINTVQRLACENLRPDEVIRRVEPVISRAPPRHSGTRRLARASDAQLRIGESTLTRRGYGFEEKSSAINKTARRANHFRFTEIDVKPEIYEDQKYFAFPEMKIMA